MAADSPSGGAPAAVSIAAVVLAAGRSTRAGALNKLLAPIAGAPMIARTVARIAASRAAPTLVVTGFEADRVRAALGGAGVAFVHNPDFADGMATSIGAGVAALPEETDGALICLGDMPAVEAVEIDRLIAAFDPGAGCSICVPVAGGRRANPVLFGRAHFAELMALSGDKGAREVIAAHGDAVAEVPMAGTGTLTDLDTPEAIAAFEAGGAPEEA